MSRGFRLSREPAAEAVLMVLMVTEVVSLLPAQLEWQAAFRAIRSESGILPLVHGMSLAIRYFREETDSTVPSSSPVCR